MNMTEDFLNKKQKSNESTEKNNQDGNKRVINVPNKNGFGKRINISKAQNESDVYSKILKANRIKFITSLFVKLVLFTVFLFMYSSNAISLLFIYYVLFKAMSFPVIKLINYFKPRKNLKDYAKLGKDSNFEIKIILDFVLLGIVVLASIIYSDAEIMVIGVVSILLSVATRVFIEKLTINKVKEINYQYNNGVNPNAEPIFTEKEIKDFTKSNTDSNRNDILLLLSKISEDVRKIKNERISFKIQNIVKISKEIVMNSNKFGSNKKFFNYYLPELNKIEATYIDMLSKNIDSEAFLKFERNFENVVAQMETAFLKMHSNLYEDDIFSVNFDLESLEKNLERDGLIDNNEFNINL